MPPLTDAIEKPNLSCVVLVEIIAGKWVRNWVANATYSHVGEVSISQTVTSVKSNGVALTQLSTLAAVQAANDSWAWVSGKLYVNKGGAFANLFSVTLVPFVTFYFANKPKTFSSQHYEPRLLSAPNVSLRIEEVFGGVGQIGGGSLSLANNDRFFDSLTDWQWHNGSVVLKLGVDTLNETMALADYQTLATWLIQDWRKADDRFTLTLKEIKSRIQQQLPLNVFTTAAFPSLPQGTIGKPIPLAYGKIIGATPFLVDPGAKQFKLADHAIFSFDNVKILRDGGWAQSSFASTNPATAEFTLGADWTGDEPVSVDFSGKKNSDNSLMANPADIVKDLFALVGETDLNTSSFTTSKNRLQAGTDEDAKAVTLRSPSLHIAESKDLFDIIGQINKEVGSYTFVDAAGNYYYGVFEPKRGEALKAFSDLDILDFSEDTSHRDILSKLISYYAKCKAENFSQVQIDELTDNQHAAGLKSPKRREPELSFLAQSDAQYFNQRSLITEGRGLRIWSLSLNWRGWLLLPGDQIRLTYTRHALDALAEILEVTYDLTAPIVRLRLGNLRAFSDTPGFWVADSDLLPTRFASLAGYGTGSLLWNKNWAAEIKTWARQNVGYWTDANGLADPTDPDSFIPSCWV